MGIVDPWRGITLHSLKSFQYLGHHFACFSSRAHGLIWLLKLLLLQELSVCLFFLSSGMCSGQSSVLDWSVSSNSACPTGHPQCCTEPWARVQCCSGWESPCRVGERFARSQSSTNTGQLFMFFHVLVCAVVVVGWLQLTCKFPDNYVSVLICLSPVSACGHRLCWWRALTTRWLFAASDPESLGFFVVCVQMSELIGDSSKVLSLLNYIESPFVVGLSFSLPLSRSFTLFLRSFCFFLLGVGSMQHSKHLLTELIC